jgi:hypothetical protein
MTEDNTTKVVINNRFGGFGISDTAAQWLITVRDWEVTQWEDGTYQDESADLVDRVAGPEGQDDLLGPRFAFVGRKDSIELRTDDDLVACVEELGNEANGDHADLKIVEVPADVDVTIKEYDGSEWVAEEHRTWP